MIDKEFYVIAFDSTHHAIQTEKQLKDHFSIEMIPTPREISASCGLSIKFSKDLSKDILKVLQTEKKEYKVFKVEKVGNSKNITKIM